VKIHHNREADQLTVAVEGRLDTVTIAEFENTLDGMLSGVSLLALDMTHLDYISSAGLRVLLKLQKKMVAQGKMKLFGVNEVVMEVLEITGFSGILNIE
jgi:anti-sigma B factor antagonist